MHDTGHCEVVQTNGLVLGSAINCAVLALLDAGVAMRGVLVATTCVVFDNGDRRTRRQR
jgi:ribonuclease PH